MIRAIKHSISRKLTLVVLATTFMALLVSAAGMLLYDIRDYRTAWVNDLTTQAEILGRVSAPALEFNDPKVAQENLQQLKARPRILSAGIYTADGDLFATYSRGQTTESGFPRYSQGQSYTIEGDQIKVFHPIQRNGEIVGTVYLHARYELFNRMADYLIILAGVMVGSLLFAAILAIRLQATITKPILAVTDIAREVIRSREFSFRVKKTTEDEIGILVDAFNGMLSEVGQLTADLKESNGALTLEMNERRAAEEALRQLNETLEQRIIARTAELESAHEQLRQAQKMEAVGQLTGGIAHDFNNLLAGIVANIEMMQIRISQGRTSDLNRYIVSAMSSTDRAAALTHRLLAFSRRQTLDPKPTDINRLVSSIEDLIRRSVGPGIQVNTILSDGLWSTMCDSHQLENAVLNLAINARDAMPDGGKLSIETSNTDLVDSPEKTDPDAAQQKYVTISVTDTGTGMSPEVLARAFDPFFTTKPLGQGTGLGLSMVYGFVKQSGGYIRIDSEPGRGTTVRLYMPRHAGAEAMKTLENNVPNAPRAATRETVLLVDDEAPIRMLATEMLAELGYSVLAAEDGPQALRILRSSKQIDLLISDVGLPNGMNGRQLADAARTMRPDLRVLFITGYAQAASIGAEQLAPGMELMTKPFKLDVFATKVAAMMGVA
jgi:signal transduction histidine kinase/CheY-like chemotaxis protein